MKHNIPQEDVLYAIVNRKVEEVIPGRSHDRKTKLYIGHPHAQTEDYIEVMTEEFPVRNVKIFHAMPLREKFRQKYLHLLV